MARTALLLLALAAAAAAQDAPKALPAGQTKKLQAVALEVTGTVQWRANAKDAWKPLKANDLLDPGAEVRTGRDSKATLRAGMNGTIEVDRQSRIAIPALEQEGATLKTRVAMTFGRADLKVDRVGLDNDFEVSTPTATLAVKGTATRVSWDAVRGFRAAGVPSNGLRSVEVSYLRSIETLLSGDDGTDETAKWAVVRAFLRTFYIPLPGDWDNPSLEHIAQLGPRDIRHLFDDAQLKVMKKLRQRSSGQEPGGGQQGPPPSTGQ